MNIFSFKPDHDGAIACVKGAHLLFSIEAEKNSNYRYSPISIHDMFNVLGELDELPDEICTGGWWPRESALRRRAYCSWRQFGDDFEWWDRSTALALRPGEGLAAAGATRASAGGFGVRLGGPHLESGLGVIG